MKAANDMWIQNIAAEIAGNERQIIDDFCKAFIAQKCLNGMTCKYILENFKLCVEHDLNKNMCSKYWFE
jgi:hypothetical protein